MVCGDVNGDGAPDQAVLGYRDHLLLLAIRQGGQLQPQIIQFAIGGGVQQGVCSLPVTLRTNELVCDTEEGQLSGCKIGRGTVALSIEDGDCDPINLYWSHEAGGMVWWRN
ncbi:hypothetical protein UAJ10_04760 [Nitrospirillum sp. BR 11164]|uniref:hypothetical protein n=1 Tax=Nitrospirillum sp. BR 11164 TaxID=3104324 RepID=UPI002AFF588E|nr:hypothetical protein [Nitrospirillum sp. BR 11164]MEA1648327.1 hypothetical protein [Nitrospirillum sp. BR 11164]